MTKNELQRAIDKLWTGDAIELGIKYRQRPTEATRLELVSAIRSDLYCTYTVL